MTSFFRFHDWMAQIVCPIDNDTAPCMRHQTSSPTLPMETIIRSPDDRDMGGDIDLMIPASLSQVIRLSCLLLWHCHVGCDRCQMSAHHWSAEQTQHFCDLRSYFTLYCVTTALNFFWVIVGLTDWLSTSTVLYLECKIINSTKEYFLFSQLQPED